MVSAVASIVSTVLRRAADQRIILLHDGYANTLHAIPQILDGLRARNLCPGKVVPAATSIPNQWGDAQYVRVVAF